MEYIAPPLVHRVLCADCGTPIEPNSANLCIACLRNSVDITEGIPKQSTVNFCRNCDRYLSPPATWTIAEHESRELLAICLKKLKGLNKVRLVDAGFIWTEPHSKRIRVKLTIQKEVFTSTIIQQIFEVEYVVVHGQCPDCTKLAAKNTWKAMVQVRQKVNHKRTFLYLEQLILKHNAHKDTISIKEAKDGLDFFYAQRSHAIKMVEFLSAVVPVRTKSSEQLLSTDTHSGTSSYKFTYSVEIIPICKDDLVCIPPKQARSLSNIQPLTVCARVGNSIHLMDPQTLQVADVTSPVYWRTPFDSLATASDTVEFLILDIEPSGPKRGKFVLSDAQVTPVNSSVGGQASEWVGDGEGQDAIFHTRTHLGGILQPGDTALGYFLTKANYNNSAFDTLDPTQLPDIVLVKKTYPNRRKKVRTRNWRLKSIAKEAEDPATGGHGRGALGRMGGVDQAKVERDYEMFLRELEEDPELRGNVNLYKADDAPEKKVAADEMDVDEGTEDEDEPDFPDVQLDELLNNFEDMSISGEAEGAH
ncbi:NMD3-domain-containing protein [Calocera cornea HHB12733]|uniref:60S ribosomal export protein NMD3 n=1 Tax=Calocera cornea HHB12733 TaxID=1353952 RepID=A0A165K1W2_9BASI|nr:NMD3-domain-containing protein [Calocera cornea HHB12733]